MPGLIQDEKGDASTMRLISIIGTVAGALVLIASAVAMFLGIDSASTMGGVAAGVIGASVAGKYAQKRIE